MRAILSLTPLLALLWGPTASATPLEPFLESALEHHPDIAVAEAQADAARANVHIARSNLLPDLSLTGIYTRNIPEVKAVIPVGTEVMELVILQANQLDGRAQLTLPLFVPGAIANTTAAAAQRDAGEQAAEASKAATLLSVVQSYWTTVATLRIEAAANEGLEAAKQNLAVAKARFDLDAAGLIDLRRAEAEEARARQAAVQAVADRKAAHRRLVVYSGLDALPDEDPTPRSVPEGDLLDRARQTNPQVRASTALVDASRARLAATRWSYAPTVVAFARANVSNATGFSGQELTGTAGVQADWSLFDGGAREGQGAAASAGLREAEASLDGARRAVDLNVAASLDAVEASRLKVEAAELGAQAADEASRLADEQFRLGAIDTATLTLARRDAFNAAVQAASASLELAVAVEQLRVLVGEPLIR